MIEMTFDTVERKFLYSVLKRFNFGEHFIKWMMIVNENPMFKVKNNGWLSGTCEMKRGIRQGCSLSALLFTIVIEILAIMVRSADNISGIIMNDNEHKIIQYADDATLCIRDLESIPAAIELINRFSSFAGPKLNIHKTKGIWLGTFKDLGHRVFCDITWTGNPVKFLGIYIGHNREKCYALNWSRRLDKIAKSIQQLKCRKLTLYGKIQAIKSYIISKIVYPSSVLIVPTEVKEKIRSMYYFYIWGKRDRVKRSTMVNSKSEGGVNMVDFDNFFLSLKASFVPKIISKVGKWTDYFYFKLEQLNLSADYLWKTTFKTADSFPIIKKLSAFYLQVILAYNKCKSIKPLEKLNKHEIAEQPIWGNHLFRTRNTCLYLKNWVNSNFLYIKDIITKNGNVKSDNELFQSITAKQNIWQELYLIKNYVIRKIQMVDLSIAPFVKIRQNAELLFKNKLFYIKDQKSKFFYEILKERSKSRGAMESLFSREFSFENDRILWTNIYKQKLVELKDSKLCEFNFKILHNIVPCGYTISKWQNNISKNCSVCNCTETTKHMLFECNRVKIIWNIISYVLKIDISWKNIVCGFPKYITNKKTVLMNYIFTIVSYAIFKENSYCKFNDKRYEHVDMKQRIKQNLLYYKNILAKSVTDSYRLLDDCINHL